MLTLYIGISLLFWSDEMLVLLASHQVTSFLRPASLHREYLISKRLCQLQLHNELLAKLAKSYW